MSLDEYRRRCCTRPVLEALLAKLDDPVVRAHFTDQECDALRSLLLDCYDRLRTLIAQYAQAAVERDRALDPLEKFAKLFRPRT